MSELRVKLTVAGDTSSMFAVDWSERRRDANVTLIKSGGHQMSNLFRVIAAATPDARRAEALMADTRSRRALHIDREGALLAFELRAGSIGDQSGERETRIVRRDRGVQAARRNAALI
jgi:hypothetical protein